VPAGLEFAQGLRPVWVLLASVIRSYLSAGASCRPTARARSAYHRIGGKCAGRFRVLPPEFQEIYKHFSLNKQGQESHFVSLAALPLNRPVPVPHPNWDADSMLGVAAVMHACAGRQGGHEHTGTRRCGPYLDADEREVGGNVPLIDGQRPLLQPGVGHQERPAEHREGGPQLVEHVPEQRGAGFRVQGSIPAACCAGLCLDPAFTDGKHLLTADAGFCAQC